MNSYAGSFAIVGLLIASAVSAAVPNQMNVQGRLLNAGSPMAGSHPAIFRIYDDPAAGNLLWSETSSLSVQAGIFTAGIGAVTPIPTTVFDNQPRWLEVTVDGNTLSPRVQLTTSAYAFRAQRADTANVALSGAGGDLWSTDGTNVWRPSGSVGIGTSTPTIPWGVTGLDVNGIVEGRAQSTGALSVLALNTQGHVVAAMGNHEFDHGIVQVFDASGTETVRLSGTPGTNMWINNGGNIGIGTIAPLNKLQVTGGGVMGDWLTTPGTTLGNGSVYGLLGNDHLEFHGSYGYGVGDEYIDFQSGFNPQLGGQGTMARITGYRNPEEYDYARGRMKFSLRSGSGIADIMDLDVSGVTITGNLAVSGTKCRVVHGTEFGDVYYNATESAHALFTLEGESTLRDGRCVVDVDPKWLAGVTIDQIHPMSVTITAFYG